MKVLRKEYLEKKLSIAKSILPTLLNKVDSDAFIADPLKRGSLVYKSGALAEALLRELGYELSSHDDISPPIKGKVSSTRAGQDTTGMISLGELNELNKLKKR